MNQEKTIIDYGRIFYIRRWPIIILSCAIIIFTYINTIRAEKGYTAKATIFPTSVTQSNISSFLLSNLSGGVMRQDANILLVLFKSQNIAELVVQKLKLEYLGERNNNKKNNISEINLNTASLIKSKINSFLTKDGAVELNLELKNPDLAQKTLDLYINVVATYIRENSFPIDFNVVDSPRASHIPSSPDLKTNLIAAIVVAIIVSILFSMLDDRFHLISKQ